MEIITCPYCECQVDMGDVDAEGGACPECGALTTSSIYEQEDDLDALDDDNTKPGDLDDDDDDMDVRGRKSRSKKGHNDGSHNLPVL